MAKYADETGGAVAGLKSGGRTTANTGGSMSFSQDSPKSKSNYQGGNADVKALAKAGSGKLETMRGKTVN